MRSAETAQGVRAVQEKELGDGASYLDLEPAWTPHIAPVSLAWLPLSLALRTSRVWRVIWQLDISAKYVSKFPSLGVFYPGQSFPTWEDGDKCGSKVLPLPGLFLLPLDAPSLSEAPLQTPGKMMLWCLLRILPVHLHSPLGSHSSYGDN